MAAVTLRYKVSLEVHISTESAAVTPSFRLGGWIHKVPRYLGKGSSSVRYLFILRRYREHLLSKYTSSVERFYHEIILDDPYYGLMKSWIISVIGNIHPNPCEISVRQDRYYKFHVVMDNRRHTSCKSPQNRWSREAIQAN